MAEDLSSNLQSYQIQLQQVEAALTNEPDNEELLKLKKDLQQSLGLNTILISDMLFSMKPGLKFSSVNFSVCGSRKCHDVSSALIRLHYWAPSPSKALGTVAVAAFRKESGATEVIILTTELINANTEKSSSSVGSGASNKDSSSSHSWKIGDGCLAPWSEDGLYYEAVIDDITEDGQCTVNFAAYGNTDVCDAEQLRSLDKDHRDFSDGSSKSRKQLLQAHKDYKKKKAQKKAQRMKQLEEEREKEKVKWHSFNAKAFNKKGHVKKSIFASPDNINGRVGIGTCGIGGRPMTEFQQQEKWRRGPAGGILGNIKAGAATLKGHHSSH
ncbi:survival of motor neuron-related-splicing factor 30 [Trichonephila clavata]|uniref:Survival of motor neuron-related-splicing factor 30 n=1 Tax=Trichonephila clavata TaxID=2740835 RepID=A0A8X6G1V6_TRICU|nr:survival of motor neuron-related-splicing factor 30 [Trichonephila clavata]